jgi:hypothetical protein
VPVVEDAAEEEEEEEEEEEDEEEEEEDGEVESDIDLYDEHMHPTLKKWGGNQAVYDQVLVVVRRDHRLTRESWRVSGCPTRLGFMAAAPAQAAEYVGPSTGTI